MEDKVDLPIRCVLDVKNEESVIPSLLRGKTHRVAAGGLVILRIVNPDDGAC